jgi:hypothetical protein
MPMHDACRSLCAWSIAWLALGALDRSPRPRRAQVHTCHRSECCSLGVLHGRRRRTARPHIQLGAHAAAAKEQRSAPQSPITAEIRFHTGNTMRAASNSGGLQLSGLSL